MDVCNWDTGGTGGTDGWMEEQMDGWMESWREGRQMKTINLVTIADWKQPGVGGEGLWRGGGGLDCFKWSFPRIELKGKIFFNVLLME